MADVITDYQGTIDEFMGDGILVLFGAPTQRPDDAKRAIACAVAMQLAMVEVNKQIEAWDLNALEMGIGINTGEVVVGNLGSEKRTKYGVVGSQVNLAYRIESYTTGGQIIISETTLKEAGEDLIEIENQKLVQPKGVKRPINIYEVGGIRDKYNLFVHKEEEIFYPLSESIFLYYTILEGKHVGENLFTGEILALSNKGALILAITGSESLPTMLTNIKLNLKSELPEMREDIYAKVLEKPAKPNLQWNSNQPDPATSKAPWRIYNIGNNKPIELMKYINNLENALGKKAIINFLPLQPGDISNTYADISALKENFNYAPSTPVAEGVNNFVNWYKEYYKK
jgi:adenylate cyclase